MAAATNRYWHLAGLGYSHDGLNIFGTFAERNRSGTVIHCAVPHLPGVVVPIVSPRGDSHFGPEVPDGLLGSFDYTLHHVRTLRHALYDPERITVTQY